MDLAAIAAIRVLSADADQLSMQRARLLQDGSASRRRIARLERRVSALERARLDISDLLTA
jgi:hypothetical protein